MLIASDTPTVLVQVQEGIPGTCSKIVASAQVLSSLNAQDLQSQHGSNEGLYKHKNIETKSSSLIMYANIMEE